MSEEIFYSDAATLARRIRERSLSPVEVMQAHLDRIESVNPTLNALVAFPDGVMEQAREAEVAAMRGEYRGPLHGVPFTVKDCVDTEGVVTTRGSKLFEDHIPETDATVVRRLKDAGGIFIAKSNMPEFALWWETDNLVYGRTENPWMIGRTPGGSSGGEAAPLPQACRHWASAATWAVQSGSLPTTAASSDSRPPTGESRSPGTGPTPCFALCM